MTYEEPNKSRENGRKTEKGNKRMAILVDCTVKMKNKPHDRQESTLHEIIEITG